jgi:hypothetical protein
MSMAILEEQLAQVAAMSSAELRREWQRVMLSPPPPSISIALLERGIAYELQARVHGGLSKSTRRQLERLRRELERTGSLSSSRETMLKPGTRLSRDWHGRTHHILVLDDGYLFEDRRYRSLSQIASAITGTKWSGPRFFGLKRSPSLSEEDRGKV